MKRLLVLGAGLGVLSACVALRSALRAVDGALEGLGRVPLKRVDGLLDRLWAQTSRPWQPRAAWGLSVVASPFVPRGKIAFVNGDALAHPDTLYGHLAPWEEVS